MKTNYIPAIVMLSAGFIDCLFAIFNHLELREFTTQLLIVLIVFWVIGCIIKRVLDKNFEEKNNEEPEENTDQVEEENEEDKE